MKGGVGGRVKEDFACEAQNSGVEGLKTKIGMQKYDQSNHISWMSVCRDGGGFLFFFFFFFFSFVI